MFDKLKQFITWKLMGDKIYKFIDLNCNALLEEFPDIEYLTFKYKGKVFHFTQKSDD